MTSKLHSVALVATLISLAAFAEDEPPAAAPQESQASQDAPREQVDGIDGPTTMSGMSILGNEEAPKSLVIIPWKSSELGDDISLTDTLDDRAQPVDKEVFLRELRFHAIRSGEQDAKPAK